MKLTLVFSDGISLRNFIYSDFLVACKNKGIKVNVLTTNFAVYQILISSSDISSLVEHCRYIQIKENLFTKLLKRIIVIILHNNKVDCFIKKRGKNNIYRYFKKSLKGRAELILDFIFSEIIVNLMSLSFVELMIQYLFHRTTFWSMKNELDGLIDKSCKSQEVVLFTNQRDIQLSFLNYWYLKNNLDTYSFIYSWDNPFKFVTRIFSKFTFTWSEGMNQQLKHHEGIKNCIITGSPQFNYRKEYCGLDFNKALTYLSENYMLPIGYKYLCFSGDDLATSPDDQYYFRDLCDSVKSYNLRHNEKFHVIFRRCPADNSERYNQFLEDYSDVVTEIKPDWIFSDDWKSTVPKKSDSFLLAAVIVVSDMVFNLGSTMMIDFALFKKPCAYFNYKSGDSLLFETIYKLPHLEKIIRSESVFWINSKSDIDDCLKSIISENLGHTVERAVSVCNEINFFDDLSPSVLMVNFIINNFKN